MILRCAIVVGCTLTVAATPALASVIALSGFVSISLTSESSGTNDKGDQYSNGNERNLETSELRFEQGFYSNPFASLTTTNAADGTLQAIGSVDSDRSVAPGQHSTSNYVQAAYSFALDSLSYMTLQATETYTRHGGGANQIGDYSTTVTPLDALQSISGSILSDEFRDGMYYYTLAAGSYNLQLSAYGSGFSSSDDGYYVTNTTFSGATFHIQSSPIVAITDVPEPATWVVLMGAVGMLGAARRRVARNSGDASMAGCASAP